MIFLFLFLSLIFCFSNQFGSLTERNLTGWGPESQVEQLTGFVTVPGPVVNTSNNHYFYWFFGAREKAATAPLLVMFSGGPACSSLLMMLFENGPIKIAENGTMLRNEYSWNSAANTIWVEMPPNTGFSFSENPENDVTNEDQISEQMWSFFQVWLPAHPELSHREFAIMAESYGGHYAPAISGKFIDMNKQGMGQNINLKGVAIGNGLTDPIHQYAGYAPFALQRKLIDDILYEEMQAAYDVCYELLENSFWDAAFLECMLGVVEVPLMVNPGINVYNIEEKCAPGHPLCYNFDALTAFLNRADVQSKIGITKRTMWAPCNMVEHALFSADWSHSFAFDLVKILDESDVKLLIYNGQQDYICNWVTQVFMLKVLPWSGLHEWNQMKDANWTQNGQVVGVTRSLKGLTKKFTPAGGHMLPHDSPQLSLIMMTEFLKFQ